MRWKDRVILVALALTLLLCLGAMTAKTMNHRQGWTFYSAELDVPAGATTELVAAVAGKRIRVVGVVAVANVSGTVTFKSSTTAISGDIPVAAKGGVVMPLADVRSAPYCGWMDTAAGEALNVTTVTCTLDGVLVYAIHQ